VIAGIERALIYLGGVPQALVPDNLKAAVKKACRCEPLLNESFEDFAAHYDLVVLPTRPARPQDKSLVEAAVNLTYRRIFAPLRDQVFFSLPQLNQAIQQLLPAYNQSHFQGRSYSRTNLFEEVEKPLLRPLPNQRYQLREYALAKVQKNCHVLLSADKHYYSVPYRYIGQKIKLCYSEGVVEIYASYERIALHERNIRHFGYTTKAEHLPSTHQFVASWSKARFEGWASKVGPQCLAFITSLLESKKHPEQGYKACLGVLQLEKKVGKDRLEKACSRALHYQNYSYRTIREIRISTWKPYLLMPWILR
jgi:transposase